MATEKRRVIVSSSADGVGFTPTADTFYARGFAAFYDRYGTGWTRDVVPLLIVLLAQRIGAKGGDVGTLLDLACGTGVAASAFHQAGWRILGLDISQAMLDLAAERLASGIADGTVSLRQADATDFAVAEPVDACISLEGALNHLRSVAELDRCVTLVADALKPGGTFVFDLYEPLHFQRWHHITVIDEAEAVIVKRGVWDEAGGIGMLRISGVLDDGALPVRVNQTVTSRTFASSDVVSILAAAGMQRGRLDLAVPPCTCGSPAADQCRTVYLATKTEAPTRS